MPVVHSFKFAAAGMSVNDRGKGVINGPILLFRIWHVSSARYVSLRVAIFSKYHGHVDKNLVLGLKN